MKFVTLKSISDTPGDLGNPSCIVPRIINTQEVTKVNANTYPQYGFFELWLKDALTDEVKMYRVYSDPVEFGAVLNSGGILH